MRIQPCSGIENSSFVRASYKCVCVCVCVCVRACVRACVRNVRSLVEDSGGDPRICRKRPLSNSCLLRAMKYLTAGKAAGESGILPGMVINGGRALHLHILSLMTQIWSEAGVVAAWRDALLVPIPKKGNLHICDNWRGISLLDVIGKLFARILQDRLQCVAEGLLPESQSGFRRGRGCYAAIDREEF